MMLYEPGRVFQLHENTGYSSVGGGIGVLQTSPVNHQFHYTVPAGCSPKQVRPVIKAARGVHYFKNKPDNIHT